MSIPKVTGGEVLGDRNIFVRNYKTFTDERWRGKLLQTVPGEAVDGINFPGFPDQETQRRMHGATSPEISLNEAFNFYKFIKAHAPVAEMHAGEHNMLDFGCGWGRINRPFMKDIPYSNIFAYEPHLGYCVLARKLNPYITILNGDYMPNGVLPNAHFDLVVGWSVFSHLSEDCAKSWLKEFTRILKPGGRCVLTTWGTQFLGRLKNEAVKLQNGEAIDWYSKVCIDAAQGRIAEKSLAYDKGQFVWFTAGNSKLYGEAFLPQAALQRWLDELKLGLEIEAFDTKTLSQDCFVLKMREA